MSNFKGKVKRVSKEIDHFQGVFNGLNFLIDKKAVVIDGDTVRLYEELWGSDPAKIAAWKKNTYLYMRMKKNHPKGMPVFFKNIETGNDLGRYEDSSED